MLPCHGMAPSCLTRHIPSLAVPHPMPIRPRAYPYIHMPPPRRWRRRRNISERWSPRKGTDRPTEPAGRPGPAAYKSPRAARSGISIDRSLARSVLLLLPLLAHQELLAGSPVAAVEARSRRRRLRLLMLATPPTLLRYQAPRWARWKCRRWVASSSTARPGHRGSGGPASCTTASCSPWPSSAAQTVSPLFCSPSTHTVCSFL